MVGIDDVVGSCSLSNIQYNSKILTTFYWTIYIIVGNIRAVDALKRKLSAFWGFSKRKLQYPLFLLQLSLVVALADLAAHRVDALVNIIRQKVVPNQVLGQSSTNPVTPTPQLEKKIITNWPASIDQKALLTLCLTINCLPYLY